VKIKERVWFPVFYIFVLTFVLTAILIVFGFFTREQVKNNARIAFERAVLESIPIDLPEKISIARIHELYASLIRDPDDHSGTALRYMKNDSLIAYVLPIQGAGFWAPIKGVIGIAKDSMTITGISFYEQNETPGLGGEIVKYPFRSQFKGKILLPGPRPIEIRTAAMELDKNAVHAITGATQTSMRLESFLNEALSAWLQAIGKNQTE
jgi:Na+-transporting NADH:ubiquinone oxidoreductase subunit C